MLDVAHMSRLGVEMTGNLVLSAVGQADDTVLLSNDLKKLSLVLKLVIDYCTKYNVQLSPTKTKLMEIVPPRRNSRVLSNPICIGNQTIDFVQEAEHVGILRSTNGNMPNILRRVAAFKKALGSIVSCGLSQGRSSNPVASLRILNMYGTPVLMSGLASLVLSDKEVGCIDQQYKRKLQNIIKLPLSSPASLVYFISGSLPATAILHLRQLTLFSMVCRLPGDPLHIYAEYVLSTSASPASWFLQIRDLHLKYHLPHPLQLLQFPPDKAFFKRFVKSKVLDYWECKLRREAELLPSLYYFHSQFMSLSSPHKILTTAGNKPYEVSKARIQLLLLSSKYPCAKLTRHWSPEYSDGCCTHPPCKEQGLVETVEHMLLDCSAYTTVRQSLASLCLGSHDKVIHQITLSNFYLTALPCP